MTTETLPPLGLGEDGPVTDWKRVQLHSIPEDCTAQPLEPEKADELNRLLDKQELEIATAKPRVLSARSAITHATARTAAYNAAVTIARSTMEQRQILQDRDIARKKQAIAQVEQEEEKLHSQLAEHEANFAENAGKVGLAVTDPGSPDEVWKAAFRVHGYPVPTGDVQPLLELPLDEEPSPPQTKEVLPLPTEKLNPPETPTPPEPEVPIINLAPPPTNPQRHPSKLKTFGEVVENPWIDGLLTIVFGWVLSFTLGTFSGIVTESDFSNPRLTPKIVFAILLGPTILWAIGKIIVSVVEQFELPAPPAELRPRVDLFWLWGAVLFLLWMAELTAGAKGLQFFIANANAAMLRQIGTVAESAPIIYWIAAFMMCTPYFFCKALGTSTRVKKDIKIKHDFEQAALKREEEEAKRLQRQRDEAEQAAQQRRTALELRLQEIATEDEAARQAQQRQEEAARAAHQRRLELLQSQAAALKEVNGTQAEQAETIRRFFANTPVAQAALNFSYLIASQRERLAICREQLAALRNEVSALEQPLTPEPEMVLRLQTSYREASHEAARAYALCAGDLT